MTKNQSRDWFFFALNAILYNAMVFKKMNPIPQSDSLDCEVRGLTLIKKYYEVHGLKTPDILSLNREQLVLERIDTISPTEVHFRELGEKLARFHMIPGPEFGFDSDNYIGLNRQVNGFSQNWGGFFLKNRLEFQVSLVADKTRRTEWKSFLNKYGSLLVRFLNDHEPRPSLLHGDMWSGNILYSPHGIYMIDPSVYYGDRECDLAMTQMFGGFSAAFYENYKKISPLPDGHEARAPIYNLYHYLNHYNIFGESYIAGVEVGFEAIQGL